MIEEPPKLTIKRQSRRPTPDQIDAFQGVSTGYVVDAMFGGGALSHTIKPLSAGTGPTVAVHGPALTVEPGPADVLATVAALAVIQPGDVVMVATEAHLGCAAAGDRVCGMAKNAGAVGLITDGALRDFDGLIALDMPLWCAGLSPNTPFASGPGQVGFPVQIGGHRVETGDMIVADRDGVVVVPFDRIDEVIARLATVAELEAELDAKVAAGQTVPPEIEDLLASDAVRWTD